MGLREPCEFKAGDKVCFNPKKMGSWELLLGSARNDTFVVEEIRYDFGIGRNLVYFTFNGNKVAAWEERFFLVPTLEDYPEDGTWV